MVDSLGGTLAAGEIWVTGKESDIDGFIENKDICPWTETKFDYSVLTFCPRPIAENALTDMKSSFKAQKIKAMHKPSVGLIEMQSGAFGGGAPTKLLARDKVYFVFQGKELSFGIIKAVFDTDSTEKRDMEKPVRRESLAISPRIARILINLAQVKEGQTVLDPFCGIGVILQEAVLQGINAVGIDIDASAISGAEKNTKWLMETRKPSATIRTILGDSKSVKFGHADGIAAEPSLGELLKHAIPRHEALTMAKKFEDLMIGVLNNTKQGLSVGAKIVFTSPLIQTNKERVGCDSARILSETGLKMYILKNGRGMDFPLVEIRPGKVVSREIFVFEKA